MWALGVGCRAMEERKHVELLRMRGLEPIGAGNIGKSRGTIRNKTLRIVAEDASVTVGDVGE